MKKLSIFLALFMMSSFAVQAGEARGYAACCGYYALNLGLIACETGSIDLIDNATSMVSAVASTNYMMFPPKTKKECYVQMGMTVFASGLMLGRIWYKKAHRPAPIPVEPFD